MDYEGSLTINEDKLIRICKSIRNRKGLYDTPYEKFKNMRDELMVLISWCCGLRPKECYAAKLHFLNLTECKLFIPAENNKQRDTDFQKFPEYLLPKIEEYLLIRKFFFPDSEWLFPSKSNKKGIYHLERSYYEKIFRDATHDAGVQFVKYVDKQNVKRYAYTPYGLRKGCAVVVWESTGDMIKVKEYLRQRDIKMRSTLRYIQYGRERLNDNTCCQVFTQSKIGEILNRI